jgi:hypothetical protein
MALNPARETKKPPGSPRGFSGGYLHHIRSDRAISPSQYQIHSTHYTRAVCQCKENILIVLAELLSAWCHASKK